MTEPLQYRQSSIGRARSFRKNMTDAETKLWSRLRGSQLGYYFRRQVPVGDYIVDFMCRNEKLIDEINGSQHYTKKGKEGDKIRDDYLEELGYRVLRFNTVETLQNTDGILETIYESLKNPQS